MCPWYPKGYGHELIAGVSFQTLTKLKIHCVEGLMHVKSVEAQDPLLAVQWKFAEGVADQVSWIKIMRSVANSPRVVSRFYEVNKHSLTRINNDSPTSL
ncbi:hypothetical protein TNCV_3014941 [Trichonephila clavipes]|nr:hypothetical protein TNCV_3014941 [Trichonephila clavipes]